MPYKHWRYARRVDADTLNLYTPDMTNAMVIDTGTASTTKILGQSATGKHLFLYANQTDAYPFIKLQAGASPLQLASPASQSIQFYHGTSYIGYLFYTNPDMIIHSPADDKNIFLQTTGTGVIKFGSYTAGAATDSTGYISILDAAGNARKLMVQA